MTRASDNMCSFVKYITVCSIRFICFINVPFPKCAAQAICCTDSKEKSVPKKAKDRDKDKKKPAFE